MIQCSNPHCRASSPPPISRCQTCQTPLLYRFLLAVSDGELDLSPGTLVADRYWVWSSDIWLDTQPEAPIVPLEVLPPFLVPYLRLSSLPQYVSRPFSVLSIEDSALPSTVLLLESAPIGSRILENEEIEPFLLPSLTAAWAGGTALQQLNWLQQMARLWTPLTQERVATTLLNLDGIRVDHALLRLSVLTPDTESRLPLTLVNLGQQWQALLAEARPEVRSYLGWLVKALIQLDIKTADDLVAELDQATMALAAGLSVAVDWTAHTDQGPERPRNEDACYPNGQLHQQHLMGGQHGELPLLLVCDGIGGHEQGNVASQTAIKVLLEKLQPLSQRQDLTPAVVAQHIHQALSLANDAISARNNHENRAARARMGTTVVLALVHFPYVSVAHLGDSRAYRISDRTCYQITLDDDMASRETRLGYTLYHEALQIPSGGALIQALGIADSGLLYPTVQHLLLDDPAVLLLCSDGLSDYERVDMLWRHSLAAPLVLRQGDLQSAGQDLVRQANRLNGHDNVTVGLLRFTPDTSTYTALPAKSLSRHDREISPTMAVTQSSIRPVTPSATYVPADSGKAAPDKAGFSWNLLIGCTALAALIMGIAAWVYQLRQPREIALASLTFPLSMVRLQADSLEDMTWAITDDITVGTFWQAENTSRSPAMLRLIPSPESDPETSDAVEASSASAPLIPTGSILKVVSRQTSADKTTWVRLQICSIPAGETLDQAPQETDGVVSSSSSNELDLSRRLSSPGQLGWVPERTLFRAATALTEPSPVQRGACNL